LLLKSLELSFELKELDIYEGTRKSASFELNEKPTCSYIAQVGLVTDQTKLD
jgi:hypothetical protein